MKLWDAATIIEIVIARESGCETISDLILRSAFICSHARKGHDTLKMKHLICCPRWIEPSGFQKRQQVAGPRFVNPVIW
jgi:hypothetical protein